MILCLSTTFTAKTCHNEMATAVALPVRYAATHLHFHKASFLEDLRNLLRRAVGECKVQQEHLAIVVFVLALATQLSGKD